MKSVTDNNHTLQMTPLMEELQRLVVKYLASLPAGYRFLPTDQQLMIHFLLKKINNELLPRSNISEANAYDTHPKDLAANYPEADKGVWYFFSSRERKDCVGISTRQDAGPGYWKAILGLDKVIKDNGGNILGVKTGFSYHEGRPDQNSTKTAWLMHEYDVANGYERQRLDANGMKLDDYVLCKICKTGR
ncbi:NAC domain-containing protein 58-like [Bidens hawaiensis]|uniref:NAC domain-containing protein 58-like n=1 Tax=Bidens hawaiensis TaxID=980011 RepID=UPI00404B6734